MAQNVALWSLAISIISTCSAAGCVVACWSMVSRCTRALKQLRARVSMPPSDARLAKVETDQAELFSILGKLTTTTKRLSSRAGMQDLRGKRADGPPPPGASKEELRRYYGLNGKGPREVAQMHLAINNED